MADSILEVNKKHRRTLESIFEDPVKSGILWSDIESMLKALGAEINRSRFESADSLGGCERCFSSSAPAQGNKQRRCRFNAPISGRNRVRSRLNEAMKY